MLEWKPWAIKDGTFWELYRYGEWLGSVYRCDDTYKIACTQSFGMSLPKTFSSIKEAANKLLDITA